MAFNELWFVLLIFGHLSIVYSHSEGASENNEHKGLDVSQLLGEISPESKPSHDSAQVMKRLSQHSIGKFKGVRDTNHTTREFIRRLQIYTRRHALISESQRLYKEHRATFSMKEYAYSDWTDEELSTQKGLSPPPRIPYLRELQMAQTRSTPRVRSKPLESKDWRTSGCISPPMNQKGCNACYAFATMSVVEAMRCLRNVSSTVLAPQQVIDCDRIQHDEEFKNLGCDNGWPTSVLLYLQDVGLVASESCYPFRNRRGACKLDKIKDVEKCVEPVFPSSNRHLEYQVLRDEQEILYHVTHTGPVVSAIETTESWMFYEQGIFDDPNCTRSPDDVDHAIEIVGYGSENGLEYWIVKNSLGVEWGEKGYARVKRGSNACSIGHWGWVVTG